jgi:hypothetical protein
MRNIGSRAARMLKILVRTVVALLIGGAFAFAIAVAFAVEFFERKPGRVRNGTTSGSPESLQRVHLLDRAT